MRSDRTSQREVEDRHAIATNPERQQLAIYSIGAAMLLILVFNVPYIGRVLRVHGGDESPIGSTYRTASIGAQPFA